MRHIKTHSFTLSCITFLITLLCITFLSITSLAQNTSPVKVIEFRMIPNGTMNEGRLEEKERTDYDDNPVCEIQVKAQGFDEEVMQRFKFSANGPWITKVEFDDSKNEWRIYLSSKRRGSLKIKYQGDCVFDFPAALEPKKIYELTLGMETATLNIITTPEDAAIYIDGERAGTGYASRAVSIGAEHRYKVECDDYITEESMVMFTQSEKKEVNIELRPDFGYITVKSTPSGAEVYIDKKKAGTTPYLMEKIKRGQHVVEVRKEGYEPFANMLTIKAGEMNNQYENVVLEAVCVATGTIVLESDPSGAVITIDGRQYGQTPKTLTEFPVGTYTVHFTKDGYQNLAQNLDLKDGGRETLSVTMSKTSAPQQPVAQQQPVQQQPVPQDEVIEEYVYEAPEMEEEEIVEAEIFKVVEEMPEFPGGTAKLLDFIRENIKYPMTARDSNIQGKVFVQFVVEPDGSISHVEVLRGIGGGCDEEAVRVVQSMPKFKPGKQRGAPVRVQYMVPIIFKI